MNKSILSILSVLLLTGASAKDGYITTWLVRGPYPNYQEKEYEARGGKGFFTDFLKKYGGESGVLPAPGVPEKVEFKADWSKLIAGLDVTNEWGRRDTVSHTAEWKVFSAKQDAKTNPDGNIVWFDKYFAEDDFVTAYAACTVESPVNQPVKFMIGSDDDHKLWLNGTLVGEANSSQGVVSKDFVYQTNLKAGLNNILLKIVDRKGEFGFRLALQDRNGKEIPNLKIHTVSPEIALRKTHPDIRSVLNYSNEDYLASCSGLVFSGKAKLKFISNLQNAKFVLKQNGNTVGESKNGKFDATLAPGVTEIICTAGDKTLSGKFTVYSKEEIRKQINEAKAEIQKNNARIAKAEKDLPQYQGQLDKLKKESLELLDRIEKKYEAERERSAAKIGNAGKSEKKPLPEFTAKRTSLCLNGPGWEFAATGKEDWKKPEVQPKKWIPAEMPFYSRDAFFRTWYYPLENVTPGENYGKVRVAKGWEKDFFWDDAYCSMTCRLHRKIQWDEPVEGAVVFRAASLCGEMRLFVNGKFEGEYVSTVGIVEIPVKNLHQGSNDIDIFYDRRPDPKKHVINSNVDLWSGFRGDVSLEFVPKVRTDFAFARTSWRKNELSSESEIVNGTDKAEKVQIRQYAVKDGLIMKSFPAVDVEIPANSMKVVKNQVPWTDPEVWGIGDRTGKPVLYELVTDLVKDGRIADRQTERFGFREVWTAGTNIFVNGKRVLLSGDVGWGNIMQVRKSSNILLNILRDHGIAIIRNHDGCFDCEEFFDLCDRRGMFAYANMYPDLDAGYRDNGKQPGVKEWMNEPIHEENLLNYRRWLRMLRNHPSIIILATDNEVYTQAGDSLARLETNTRNDTLAAYYGNYMKKLAPEYVITRDGDVGTWNWMGKVTDDPLCETANYHYPNFDLSHCTVNWQTVYGMRPLIYGEANYTCFFGSKPTPELLQKGAVSLRSCMKMYQETEVPVTMYMGLTGEGFICWDDTGKGNPFGVSKSMAEQGKFPFEPFYRPRVDWPAFSGPGIKNAWGGIKLNFFGSGAINFFNPDYPTHIETVINKTYRTLPKQPALVGDTAAECAVVLKSGKYGAMVKASSAEQTWISFTDKQGRAYFLLPKAGNYTISCGGESKAVTLDDMSSYCNEPGFKKVPSVTLNGK